MKLKLLPIGLALLLLALPSGFAEPPHYLWTENINGGHIATRENAVQIDHKPVHMALDTGCSSPMVIWETCLDRLGLKLSKPIPDHDASDVGTQPYGLTTLSRIEILGNVFENREIPVYRVPSRVREAGDDMDGVIGWPIVRQQLLGFNLADIGFGYLPGIDESELKEWSKFQIYDDDGVLSLTTKVGTKNVRIIVDTGSPDGVMLPPDAWKEWKAENPNAPRTFMMDYMLGGPILYKEEALARKWSIGSLVLENVPISEANPRFLRSVRPDEKIVAMGIAGLERLQLVLDGPHRVAYMAPATAPPPPYPHNRVGALFVPQTDHGTDLVAQVVPGGPAASAGLKNDDVLLAVDQVSLKGWQTHPELFEKAWNWRVPSNKKILLKLKRGDKILELVVVPKDILVPPPPTPRSPKKN